MSTDTGFYSIIDYTVDGFHTQRELVEAFALSTRPRRPSIAGGGAEVVPVAEKPPIHKGRS